MANHDTPAADTESTLLHEANGELSLHFNFPTIQSRMLKVCLLYTSRCV